VPDDIARSLHTMTDLDGRPMFDLHAYRTAWNDSFSFTFIDPDAMTPHEREIFAHTAEISALAGFDLARRGVTVCVSETMRLNDNGDFVLGVWETDHKRIVVRRDQLVALETYAGTLLHEIGHAGSGTSDGSLEFEDELTSLLGRVAAQALPTTPDRR
jgi:hypothetical protein